RPINRRVARVWIRNHGTLADVFSNLATVAARIQCRYHATPVWSLPPTDVERNPARCFLNRAWATDRRRRIPREFLCRESFQARVRENARQRSWKTKTIRQHVLGACLAKLAFEKPVAVEDLTKYRLRGRNVDVALFHRRARGKPATRRNVLFDARVIRRPVLLHHAITI